MRAPTIIMSLAIAVIVGVAMAPEIAVIIAGFKHAISLLVTPHVL